MPKKRICARRAPRVKKDSGTEEQRYETGDQEKD